MKTQHIAFILVVLVLFSVVVWFGFVRVPPPEVAPVTSFEECVAEGNAVMESYPRQCRDQAGNLHVEEVTVDWDIAYTNASEDLIRNVNIRAGDIVSSPLTITGEARGYWFFEASFPIVITDWDGRIIAQHYATAEEDWMTEEFVPFEMTIEFETPEQVTPINRGTIILQRDNPSGLPENDAALEIPVRFE